MMTTTRLGQRLKRLRTHRHVTRAELATGAEISREYVRQLEAGLSDPTVGLVARLAKVLQVPPAALGHPGRLWLCAACGRALYVTATRAVPPHSLGGRFVDPFRLQCECGAVIRFASDPPGGTNLAPLGGVVVL